VGRISLRTSPTTLGFSSPSWIFFTSIAQPSVRQRTQRISSPTGAIRHDTQRDTGLSWSWTVGRRPPVGLGDNHKSRTPSRDHRTSLAMGAHNRTRRSIRAIRRPGSAPRCGAEGQRPNLLSGPCYGPCGPYAESKGRRGGCSIFCLRLYASNSPMRRSRSRIRDA